MTHSPSLSKRISHTPSLIDGPMHGTQTQLSAAAVVCSAVALHVCVLETLIGIPLAAYLEVGW